MVSLAVHPPAYSVWLLLAFAALDSHVCGAWSIAPLPPAAH